MADALATARLAVRAASAVSPRLGARAAMAAFFSTAPRMAVRADDVPTHDAARRSMLAVGGRDIVVYRWGHGDDTVLLVHGWRGRASQFAPLVRELVHAGFHVVSFDAPAHGDSAGRRTDIRDWLAATEALQAAHGRFRAIVGHSFGGLAALTSARSGVTTATVATIAGAGTPAAFLAEFAATMDLGAATRVEFEAAFRRRFGEDEQSLARRFDAIAHPLAGGVDLLIAHDERDRQLPSVWSRRLFDAHGERARLVMTDGFGHVRILGSVPVLDATVGLVTGGVSGIDRALRATEPALEPIELQPVSAVPAESPESPESPAEAARRP